MTTRRLVRPRFWLYMMATLVAIFFCVYISQNGYVTRQRDYIAALEREYSALQEQNDALERSIEFAKTEEYIERVARESYGFVRPGQILFRIVND